jgi:hypothetical protein
MKFCDSFYINEFQRNRIFIYRVCNNGPRNGLFPSRERDHLEDPGLDGRIILRWIFRKWDRETWTGLIWLRIGTIGGHL